MFCRSNATKYFDAEIAYMGSLLELHEYKHSFVSVFDECLCHLYKISAFPLDKILIFLCQQKKNIGTVRYINQIYCTYLQDCLCGKARGVLDFGLDGGVPPGPRDPNPCLEVKKVPMFRDFAQKMDPCLGIFWKFSELTLWAQKIFVILTKNGPMFRDLGVKNGTHV